VAGGDLAFDADAHAHRVGKEPPNPMMGAEYAGGEMVM
jgi:hypothetical protein